MTQYVIRRLLLMIPTLLGVSLLVTALVRLLPGDAVDILTANNEVQGSATVFKQIIDDRLSKAGLDPAKASFGDRARYSNEILAPQLKANSVADPATATPDQKQAAQNSIALKAYKDSIRVKLGLDKNYFDQWFSWLTNALRGDLGVTIEGNRDVREELFERIPTSFELGALGMLVGLLIALPIGVLSAVKQDSWADYVARSVAIAMIALPGFFLGILVVVFASRWFGYSFPLFYKKFWQDPATNLQLVIVPAIILGIGLSGQLMRLTRTQMLEVMRQDYMRTAKAKGLATQWVVIRHGVRNAMIPVVTIIGLQVPVLIGGSLVLERIYGIPGVSQYLFSAIATRDFPVIIAVNVLVATIVVFASLVVDIAYALLDPRIRLA